MANTMEKLQINKKGCFLDKLEQFYTHNNTKQDTPLHDIYRDTGTPNYDIILAYTPQYLTRQLIVLCNSS
jgi:hypothetical protein